MLKAKIVPPDLSKMGVQMVQEFIGKHWIDIKASKEHPFKLYVHPDSVVFWRERTDPSIEIVPMEICKTT